jgi:hypothetical protein
MSDTPATEAAAEQKQAELNEARKEAQAVREREATERQQEQTRDRDRDGPER